LEDIQHGGLLRSVWQSLWDSVVWISLQWSLQQDGCNGSSKELRLSIDRSLRLGARPR
jgi:hypothetical protein